MQVNIDVSGYPNLNARQTCFRHLDNHPFLARSLTISENGCSVLTTYEGAGRISIQRKCRILKEDSLIYPDLTFNYQPHPLQIYDSTTFRLDHVTS